MSGQEGGHGGAVPFEMGPRGHFSGLDRSVDLGQEAGGQGGSSPGDSLGRLGSRARFLRWCVGEKLARG
jgi:hypothetical protein